MYLMNKELVKLIINGKLIEKKNINKNIVKNILENIIFNFDSYKKLKNEIELLKNISLYTKIINVNNFYLQHLYENVINPLLKENLNISILPNIIHTYKKNENFYYILKEINDYIIKSIQENKLIIDDINKWVHILQVFSKYKSINFIPFLQYLLTVKNVEKNTKVNNDDNNRIEKKEYNIIQVNQCYEYNKYKSSILLNNVDYKALESLSPRSLSILVNILSRIKIKNINNLNFFLYEKINKSLHEFNNIDLCLIVNSFHNLKYTHENSYKNIEAEIFKRIELFDFFQLSFIFHSLSKYWNDNKKEHFSILFMKKVKKYLNLYLIHNDEKYILQTKNKNSLIEAMPMFFLAYVKTSNSIFPYYFSYSKLLMCQFMFLNKYLLVLKKNCFFKKYFNNYNLMNLNNINQTICNLFYAFTGYLYNILTSSYFKERLFINHFFLTLNNFYQLLYFFILFYQNKELLTKNKFFIFPLHKSQLLIFLYTYWYFILDIYFSLNIYNYRVHYGSTVNKNASKKRKSKFDYFYFIKLIYIRKINILLKILDEVNLNTLMKESLYASNKYVSSIYLNILHILNNSKNFSDNISFSFNRKIIEPFTISLLCISKS
ncbi:conserved Plasmodium protein, unknown function [Plasmodium gallinaceum]|uniref:Uncharacterized protein n=1 Tax=Plasmodium gallinaceum TaxID=5849 RepID=A0A1J1H1D1_PLAGA|nr:conserved Plasmodium protein, unknown function [Plasmodium gallinaceum]CRG97117.1 conserved Plasmodium protein, unknown function [Plasmodium gallinaceum]